MSAENFFTDADIQLAAGDIPGATLAFLQAHSIDPKATKNHVIGVVLNDQKQKMVSALYDLLKLESAKSR